MRVVGGIYRHRELLMPLGDATRPTKDMVKEALFSALGYKVNDAITLDLFAGSGALGIEAISRGAKECYLVDNDLEAIKCINKNIFSLKINNAHVINSDYLEALKILKNKNIKFDLLLIDPPYKMNNYQFIIDELNKHNLINKNAAIVLESDNELNINGTYSKTKNYKYGKTFITILWK